MARAIGSLLLALFVPMGFAAVAQAEPAVATKSAAITPSPRTSPGWDQRFKLLSQRAKDHPGAELVFIGDSITHGWEGEGKEVWAKHFGDKAINLGIGGDQTQHVLWRLQNGNIAGLRPKLVVLMIGTNNSNRDDFTAEEIAAGVKAIVAELRKQLPESKILTLAIFPRGAGPSAQREKNAAASAEFAKLADNQHVYFLDIGDKFLEPDGKTLSKRVMPDLLHLSPAGYQIWADAIGPKVAELTGK
jgi:lysophospholipase L1-like esterase